MPKMFVSAVFAQQTSTALLRRVIMQEHLGKEGENGEDWHLLESAVWGDKWWAVGANPQVEPQISEQGGKFHQSQAD